MSNSNSYNNSSASSSSSSSSSSRQAEIMPSSSRSSSYSVGAVAPMPSLMSHPPLQQIKPQQQHNHSISYELTPRRISPPLLPPHVQAQVQASSWPNNTSRTPSPESSPGSSPTPSHNSPLGIGQQDFPCPYCHQVYKKVGHLNRHVLTHSGTRFACEFKGCDKTFSRLDNMRTHVKNMHPGP